VQVGIIGLAQSGKTTVFKALTHGRGGDTHAGSRLEPNVAVIKVPDKRFDAVVAKFKPKRAVPADIQFTDVAGLRKGSVQAHGMESQVLSHISKVDALLHVVRAFEDDKVPHPEGRVDALRDLETMDLELAFWDLGIIEKRLGRIVAEKSKVRATERAAYEVEAALLERLKGTLEEGQPIRDLDMTDEEEKLTRGFQFITQKPVLVLLNIGESQLSETGKLAEQTEKQYDHRHARVMDLSAKLEAELAELPDEEAAEFMADLGLQERGADRVIRAAYALLGLISFFTGPEDFHVWTVHQGANAVEAEAAIHTDLAHGFIRAEVLSYEDLMATGSTAEARREGKLKVEGKTYIVQDGDFIEVLFSK
jgi:ribosome-binding ATPase